MIDKEIIIDGIKYFKQCDINKGLDEEHYVADFHLLATNYNLLLEDYARKYNSLKEQLKAKNIKIYKTLTEIKFLVRELLKRTGQVVPYEIKQILQKISEVENGR